MKAVLYPNLRSYMSGALLLALCASAAAADYQTTLLSKNPIGYWRLNETTQPPALPIFATNASPVTGAAGNGEYLNSVVRGVTPGAIVSQPANGAAQFTATAGNRVKIPFQPQWNTPGAFSVEFWAKPASTNRGLICPAASVEFIATPTWRNGWLFYQGNGGFSFRMYHSQSGTALADAATTSASNLDTTQFYHVVGVFDGASTLKLYVNGALGATATIPAGYAWRPNTNTAIPLTFGARADGASGYFEYNGIIDEPAIYNTALSDAQVLAHYTAGTAPVPGTPYQTVILADSPVGYWRLGEPADPIADNLGTLADAGDGKYISTIRPGANGPSSPAFPGFEAANKAVADDGTNGYVTLPPLNLNTNTVTMMAWVNLTNNQPGAGAIVFSRSGGTIAGITMDAVGPTLGVGYNWNDNAANYNWKSELYFPDSEWAFVALVIEPTRGTLAVARAADYTSFANAVNPVGQTPEAFSGQTLIGRDAGFADRNVFGLIDEVAVFNRALTMGEVYSVYSASLGNVPPRIFVDPVAPIDLVYEGDQINFRVDAGGSGTLAYQWRKDGGNIAGATTSTYSFVASLTSSGNYDCVVTSAYGTATSLGAPINVNAITSPVITEQPVGRTLYTGGTLILKVVATGGKLSYQWAKGGTPISNATNATYQINGVVAGDAGSYQVTVSNPAGSAVGGPVTVTVLTPVAGSYEEKMVTAAPYSWWRFNETAGATTIVDYMGHADGYYTNSSFTLGVAGAINGNSDKAVSADGSDDFFGFVPYSAALGSTDFSIECWAKVTDTAANYAPFSFYEEGKKGEFFYSDPAAGWRAAIGAGPDPYLFYYLGDTPGATVIPNKWMHLVILYSDATGLRAYVNGQWNGNSYGDFPRNAIEFLKFGGVGPAINYKFKGAIDEAAFYQRALTLDEIQAHYNAGTGPILPSFVVQPTSREVTAGTSTTFEGEATGTVPIYYQWVKDGSELAGQTTTTLTLNNISFANVGDYQLRASNTAGITMSAVAHLTVAPLPAYANLTNGLVLHLKFEDNVTDSSGRNNNGTIVGPVSFVTGKLGKGLHYFSEPASSTYAYVNLGDIADMKFSSNVNFSVAYWVRLTNGYNLGDLPFLCSADNSYGGEGVTFAPTYGPDSPGGWSWSLNDVDGNNDNVGIYGANNSINNGNWHHLVHTFDRTGNAVTYLNGGQVDSRSIAAVGDLDRGAFCIGQGPTGAYGEVGLGDLDDMGVWRRVLSPSEAYAIYYVANNYGKSFDSYGPWLVSIYKQGTGVLLVWQGGTLVESPNVDGPWTPVAGAVAPNYTVTPGTGNKFYKVQP